MVRRSKFNSIEGEIYQKRIRKLTIFVLIMVGILFARLWFLQIINGAKYRKKSESNRIDLRDILPVRGMIFDRDGRPLVDNRASFLLGVIPEDIKDLDSLIDEIGTLLKIDGISVKRKINEAVRRNPFNLVPIKKRLTRDELARIETNSFHMPGVIIEVKPQRHYIYGPFASHLIGYLGEIDKKQLNKKDYKGNKPGDFVGKFGVEKKWQRHLNGVRGGQQIEVDASGRRLNVLYQKAAEPGCNVYLTIDKDLQMLAERSLERRVGAVVAMHPKTGEILAMASSPGFDPNNFASGMDDKGWKQLISNLYFPLQNRVISGQYPPGSLFKIVVAIAGLEEDVINPNEKIFCEGRYDFKGRAYRDWKEEGHGYINLYRALVESCDVYFYKMGQRIGIETIALYAKSLGFGSKTGLQLGDEKEGLVPNKSWKLRRWNVPWQEGETLSVSVGQSFTLVTPLQMVRFASALFNGGVLYKPQVTKWVVSEGKKRIFSFQPHSSQRWSIKKENIEFIKRALVGVVNEPLGTGKRAKLDQIRVAGKTGTAQVISLPEERDETLERDIPYKFRDHAWFVAVAPVDDPIIALAVLIEHSGTGGSVAAPIVKKILNGYFKKMRL